MLFALGVLVNVGGGLWVVQEIEAWQGKGKGLREELL